MLPVSQSLLCNYACSMQIPITCQTTAASYLDATVTLLGSAHVLGHKWNIKLCALRQRSLLNKYL